MKKFMAFVLVLSVILSCVCMISFNISASNLKLVGVKLKVTESLGTDEDYYFLSRTGFLPPDSTINGTKEISYKIRNTSNKTVHIQYSVQCEFDGRWVPISNSAISKELSAGETGTFSYKIENINEGIIKKTNGTTETEFLLNDLMVRFNFTFDGGGEIGDSILIEAEEGDVVCVSPKSSRKISYEKYYEESGLPRPTPQEEVYPVGIKVTVKKEINQIDIYSKSDSEVFSETHVVDGEIYGAYKVNNPNNFDIEVMLTYQLYDGTKWAGFNDTPIIVSANGSKDVTFSIAVTNNKVTFEGNKYYISELFVRLDIRGSEENPIPAGTYITINATQEDPIYKLNANNNYTFEKILNNSSQPTSTPYLKPVGVAIRTLKEINTVDVYLRTPAGLFDSSNIKNGAIRADYTVYNPCSFDIKIMLTYQLFDGARWSGFNDTPIIIPAFSKTDVNFSIPVVSNKVSLNKTEYDISELFVRVDIIGSQENPVSAYEWIYIEAQEGDSIYYLQYQEEGAYDESVITNATTLPDYPYATPIAYQTPVPTSTPTPTPVISKTVYNGDAEDGTKNWGTFIGGTIKNTETGADGVGKAITYVPESVCEYGSVAFSLGTAIIDAKEHGYNGGGAGEYEITFKAKHDSIGEQKFVLFVNSQAHFQKGEFLGDYTLKCDTYIGSESVMITPQWQEFTVTVEITEEFLQEVTTIYNMGFPSAYDLVFRLDGSRDAYSEGAYFTYSVDDITITKKTVKYGDVNDDTFINKKDDLALRKYLADPTFEIDIEAANVFYDTAVNKKDLLRLKQYLADPDVFLGSEIPQNQDGAFDLPEDDT